MSIAKFLDHQGRKRRDSKSPDMVKVSYLGGLIDGTVFDNSAKQGSPVTLGTSEMSKCWSSMATLVRLPVR